MDDQHKNPNRLSKETSPYLLQHAYNPVDWYPWGAEALERAKEENKPILVSIGYSSCHWCHVMEKESFEDGATAEIMNRHFINIKIDREERPDLDHIYMDAVQAMTGSGGWPLNVFLTPELKPFYGGTYFPPVSLYNRSSWKEVLAGVEKTFRLKREEVDAQAENLTQYLSNASFFGQIRQGPVDIPLEEKFNKQQLDEIFQNMMKNADKENGGFGAAPKFPSTFVIQYLLRYYHFTKNEEALKQACLSLDKMIHGGIYDQVAGGFARYSTDTEWLAPHFEKMLYDNALLVMVMSEAYQVTRKELYKDCIVQTLGFIKKEFTSAEEGFYSALDADSEGEEGKYYVWSKKEIDEILENDAAVFCAYYDVTEKGNWEHANILRVLVPLKEFASARNMDEEELKKKLAGCREKLLSIRSKRIRPGLDDKILISWNALMNKAFSKAYAALGNEEYRQVAIDNMQFLLSVFRSGNDKLFHTYKNGEAKINAFFDDYAYMIDALIHLQEITGNSEYLIKAREFVQVVMDDFADDDSPFFFYTTRNDREVIVRKKEVYDGAIPSGNSIMAMNLQYLGIIFNKGSWKDRSVQMTEQLLNAILKYPVSFAVWSQMVQQLFWGITEIAAVGTDFYEKIEQVMSHFIPHKVFQSSLKENHDFPLLENRGSGKETIYFLCKDYNCKTPEKDFTKLLNFL